MPKIVFFDIDKTLLRKATDDVPKSAVLALRALKNLGVSVAAAAGAARAFFLPSVRRLMGDLGVDAQDAWAFGDGLNDVETLWTVGRGDGQCARGSKGGGGFCGAKDKRRRRL